MRFNANISQPIYFSLFIAHTTLAKVLASSSAKTPSCDGRVFRMLFRLVFSISKGRRGIPPVGCLRSMDKTVRV